LSLKNKIKTNIDKQTKKTQAMQVSKCKYEKSIEKYKHLTRIAVSTPFVPYAFVAMQL
jgi:hypothetical protein